MHGKQRFLRTHITCLHDQNKSGFFGEPTFFHPIRVFWKLFRLFWWLDGKNRHSKKATFVL